MKLLVALSTLLAVSLAEDAKVVATPLPYYAGLPYAPPHITAPVSPVTYAAPITPYVGSQYHPQDEFGNLNYAPPTELLTKTVVVAPALQYVAAPYAPPIPFVSGIPVAAPATPAAPAAEESDGRSVKKDTKVHQVEGAGGLHLKTKNTET